MRCLLLAMPFASIRRPALGLSLLKPALQRAGIDCEVRYPAIDFARLLGVEEYERIALDLPQPALIGEWVFAGSLFGDDRRARDEYVAEILRGRWQLDDEDVGLVLKARDLAPGFIGELLPDVDWQALGLVGFASATSQNVASLALARRIKDRHPAVRIVFGGSNWDDEMGAELHRRFPFVDFACQGEADVSLPALAMHLFDDRSPGPARIPGLVYRKNGSRRSGRPAEPVPDLDTLPYPETADYVEGLRSHGLARRVGPVLLMEASRGCWWAQKSPCTFCGSPGCRRPFRRKSLHRIHDELRALAARPLCTCVELVDDVPPREFFTELVPDLAADPLPVRLFCEVRPDIGRHEVEALGRAGADVQPGIESLNDHVLRLMRKGTRGLENIRLLRWLREAGVSATWNLIYGLPGELPEDYERMSSLLPAIRFLDPPSGCGPLRLDRFSAYAGDPASFGLSRVRPIEAYRHVYPFPPSSLRRIAYSFDYDLPEEMGDLGYSTSVRETADRWQREPDSGDLRASPEGDAITINDTRDGIEGARRLTGLETVVYLACAGIARRSDILGRAQAELPDERDLPSRVDQALASFVHDRWMVRDGERYLSLALGVSALAEQPEWPARQAGSSASLSSD